MVDVSQVRALAADLRGVAEVSQQMARAAVDKSAFDVERIAKQNIVDKNIIDTGATLNSVGVTRSGGGTFARAEIGPTTEYAPYLEEGTYRTPPRPFMAPAIDEVEPGFVAAMEQIGGLVL